MLRVSRRYSILQEQAVQFLREWGPKGEVLIIAEVREAADEVARLVCDSAIMGLHRFAWRDFVYAASSRAMDERGLAPASRIVREAIASLCLDRAQLSYLAPIVAFPGTARAAAATIEDLRLNEIDLDRLRATGRSGPDLAALAALYDTELRTRNVADYASRVRLANTSQALPLLLIDVRVPSRSEQALLQQLVRDAPAVLALALDDRLANVLETPAEFCDGDVTNSLTSVQRYLFSGAAIPDRAPDESFEIKASSGEALECVEIARAISATAAGTPFDEIAILLRDPRRYRPLVAEALRRAGIPVYLAESGRAPSTSGRAFLALLRCAREGLSATRFAEYLSLGEAPGGRDNPRAGARWEKLLVDAAVIGGKDRWRKRLDGLTHEWERREAAAEEDAERQYCSSQLDSIENLRRFVLPIVEMLDALPREAPLGEWLQALDELASVTLEDATDISELLDELNPVADVGPLDLETVLRIIEQPLATMAPRSSANRYGKVWVGHIDEARGMAFRQVYAPGLNESLFPRPVREDPLLLNAQRAEVGLAPYEDDAELLRAAAASASERLVLSYSRVDLLTGRQRVPSFFAFEAFKAARGSSADIGEFLSADGDIGGARLGWPAPLDPAEAIDDIEFDLATLRSAMESGARGAGAYLNYVSPIAARSLKARYKRWELRQWTPPDGLIADDDVHLFKFLEPHRLANKPYSVSALQQFARCPYRFALQSIFHLAPRPHAAALQRMDPHVRGDIYHEIQFGLLRRLQQSGLLPINSASLENALEVLDQGLGEARERWDQNLAPAIPQVWRMEWETLRTDLRAWLRHVARNDDGWTPEYFEYAFGLGDPSGRDPHSRRAPVTLFGRYPVRGSIDLVEKHACGSVRITDHKSGKRPEEMPRYIGRGEMLQPVLYALAAEQAFGTAVGSGRLFYATVQANYACQDIALDAQARDSAEHALRTIDEAIENGFLPAAPKEDGCRRCDYLPVCGPYEEERAKKKHSGRLAQLHALRKMP